MAFAAVACVLSGLGLYGMLAYRVRQRAQEIGVRIALGASARQVVGFVVGEGARLLARGMLAGFVGAAAAARLLSGLLYGVEPADPPTAAAVLAVILLLGALATWLPAVRATRVDPAVVLRRAEAHSPARRGRSPTWITLTSSVPSASATRPTR